MKENIKILAIETSCDETAAAVIGVANDQPIILSNIISSQIDLHAKTGGVVPEVASRAHMEAILPVVAEALLTSTTQDSNNTVEYQTAIELLNKEITHVAVTAGPGLIGSLLVGFNAAKTLAYAKSLPIVPINHIEGHLYSAFLDESGKGRDITFPILALTVSGGHTSLTLVADHGEYKVIGETLDDAVGEAYDKVAKMLGLGYPGGPIISKLASQFRALKGIVNIIFPRPIINDGSLNFSFSGLKTAVLIQVKKILAENNFESVDQIDQSVQEEIAYAFEEAVADVLVAKMKKAIEKHLPRSVVFAGGVSANGYLRQRLKQAVSKIDERIVFLAPHRTLSGDNAAMIGVAAYYHIKNDQINKWNEIQVDSNLELS